MQELQQIQHNEQKQDGIGHKRKWSGATACDKRKGGARCKAAADAVEGFETTGI